VMFFLPMASGPSSALFATKVALDVQGRVFATRSMISQSMMPLAYLLGGLLADRVFEPLLIVGGLLSDTFVAKIVGVGPGRGMGFMMVCSGLILLVVSLVAFLNPRIRYLETEIPDAVTEERQTDLDSSAEEGMVSQPVQG
jgi:MFS transporter, DHA3 family, macrolide efflux protein